MFVGFCLGRDCWVGTTLFASGFLNFRCCCTLRLEGNSQVGIIFTCVSSEGRVLPNCTIVAQLPISKESADILVLSFCEKVVLFSIQFGSSRKIAVAFWLFKAHTVACCTTLSMCLLSYILLDCLSA